MDSFFFKKSKPTVPPSMSRPTLILSPCPDKEVIQPMVSSFPKLPSPSADMLSDETEMECRSIESKIIKPESSQTEMLKM